jgi:hypothetical protein
MTPSEPSHSTYRQAQDGYEVITDDADEAGGMGPLYRNPHSPEKPLRRIATTDEIVRTVLHVHHELGHGK